MEKSNITSAMKILFLFTLMLLLFASCNPEPQQIRMGEEECAHCSMMINDEQFAAQLVATTGRHYNFDAIECMAAFVDGFDGDIHSLWVHDYFEPGEWIDATQATYLHSDQLRSPMSVNISAYRQAQQAGQNQAEYDGNLLDWDEVKVLVREKWGQ